MFFKTPFVLGFFQFSSRIFLSHCELLSVFLWFMPKRSHISIAFYNIKHITIHAYSSSRHTYLSAYTTWSCNGTVKNFQVSLPGTLHVVTRSFSKKGVGVWHMAFGGTKSFHYVNNWVDMKEKKPWAFTCISWFFFLLWNYGYYNAWGLVGFLVYHSSREYIS